MLHAMLGLCCETKKYLLLFIQKCSRNFVICVLKCSHIVKEVYCSVFKKIESMKMRVLYPPPPQEASITLRLFVHVGLFTFRSFVAVVE
jgi:hypothetical protein